MTEYECRFFGCTQPFYAIENRNAHEHFNHPNLQLLELSTEEMIKQNTTDLYNVFKKLNRQIKNQNNKYYIKGGS